MPTQIATLSQRQQHIADREYMHVVASIQEQGMDNWGDGKCHLEMSTETSYALLGDGDSHEFKVVRRDIANRLKRAGYIVEPYHQDWGDGDWVIYLPQQTREQRRAQPNYAAAVGRQLSTMTLIGVLVAALSFALLVLLGYIDSIVFGYPSEIRVVIYWICTVIILILIYAYIVGAKTMPSDWY